MIEERGRVVSIEGTALWVETIHSSACSGCEARAGCGQALLQRLGGGTRQGFIRVLGDSGSRVGDEVVIGVPETAVVRGSSLVYLIPLLSLFGCSLLAQALGAGEPMIIIAGFVGLALGFISVRWYTIRLNEDPAFVPQVLSRTGKSNFDSDIHVRSDC